VALRAGLVGRDADAVLEDEEARVVTRGSVGRCRRRWVGAVVIVAASLVLLTSCVGTDGSGPDDGSTSTATDAVATIPAPLDRPLVGTGDAVLDDELTSIARFVEQERGRPFRTAVTVELLDDASFRARLAQVDAPADVAIRQQEALLEAVDAIPADFDLVALSHQTSGEGVLGFYDPETGGLVVRGSITPFTRITLAHELTHALDAQWYPVVFGDVADADQDRQFARAALAEGSAQVVEGAYRESLPLADRGEAIAEEERFGSAMVAPEGVPPDLFEGLTDVYVQGLAFVEAVMANGGGMAALDAAFATPPPSSEQILHVERYRAGELPVDVAGPPADGTEVVRGRMGEAGLLDLLQLGLAPNRARTAAEGWGGDRYVVWRSGSAACLRVDTATDTSADAVELATAGRSWSNGTTRAVVEDQPSGAVRFTMCTT
jgi:hypothetical protein